MLCVIFLYGHILKDRTQNMWWSMYIYWYRLQIININGSRCIIICLHTYTHTSSEACSKIEYCNDVKWNMKFNFWHFRLLQKTIWINGSFYAQLRNQNKALYIVYCIPWIMLSLNFIQMCNMHLEVLP